MIMQRFAAVSGALMLLSASTALGQEESDQLLRFDRLDANKDGRIDRPELETAARALSDQRFAAMDANGDDALSEGEYEDAMAKLRAQQKHRRRRPFGRGSRIKTFAEVETSGDGRIDRSELFDAGTARRDKLFSFCDADSDGLLTQVEVDRARERLKKLKRRFGR